MGQSKSRGLYSRNCVIPVVCVFVRTLRSVGSQTQLSLRCNYVLKNNYMFWPMMAIVRLLCLAIPC